MTDRIQALEGAIAAALETLAKAKAEAAAEGPEPTAPRLATWEDGVAAARARYGKRTTGSTEGNGTAEGGAQELTGRAAGIEAARRRAARHGGAA